MQMALTMQVTPFIPKFRQGQPQNLNFPNKHATLTRCSLRNSEHLVSQFNPKIPIEEAVTPPTSWYTDPSLFQLELDRVFYRGWQVVGSTEQIKDPNNFFTGRLGDVEFVVCRDETGMVRSFHNVCRHHASLLASGTGQKSCFVCPYHGWTYGLNGALLKATRISGMRDFNVKGRILGLYQSKYLPGGLLFFSIWRKRAFLGRKSIVITWRRNGLVAVQKY